ncbi:class I SAM-dependent methyltransferase [Halosolutus gelatinilyticus]|uniref:class I SAM-dependent methyltransferase n=1 Tax=Halosolutus gelatinilyticus TaxID=2931975 RepID=UPI001FF3D558|nr:class I SAM-dependent methyltransferase [Halosolutus gelatinilyticus]
MNAIDRILHRVFGRPSGLAGRLGGRLMARMNAETAQQVIDALGLSPTDAVLEVGFGPGIGIEYAAEIVTDGRVAGVDYSSAMVEQATRRNEAAIDAGRVDLHYGTVEQLPFADGTFEAAFSINSIHAWPDPADGLREIRRTLRPGGTIAIAVTQHSTWPANDPEALLREAGFTAVERREWDDATCVFGRVPNDGSDE